MLAAPPELDETADLVHTGRGALCWMMDLDAWAHTIYRLLKPGGKLHVFEGHPLDWVWDVNAAAFQFDPECGDYFTNTPYAGEIWPKPFVDRQAEVDPASLSLHDHPWTLGQILNSVIGAGLRIEYFEEYPQTFWDQFPNIPPDTLRRLPHTFTLLAAKEKPVGSGGFGNPPYADYPPLDVMGSETHPIDGRVGFRTHRSCQRYGSARYSSVTACTSTCTRRPSSSLPLKRHTGCT